MKVFITGVTGFVGTHLAKSLLDAGHEVTGIGTRPRQKRIEHERFCYISADATRAGEWQDAVRKSHGAVNLAGASIFKWWTESHKKKMHDSRILTTRNLVEAIPAQTESGKPFTLLSTSAVGYYGDRGNEILTEDSAPADDYLAELSKAWEAEAMHAEKKGARVALMRLGIVLGKKGGAMEKMIPAFRMYVGGPLGDGSQWFPWIHISDLVGAAGFLLEKEDLSGHFNFTAPNPVRNRTLSKTLAALLNRPAFFRTPGFMIKFVLGELGDVMLYSQRVVPERLGEAGYEYTFPDIRSALAAIVNGA